MQLEKYIGLKYKEKGRDFDGVDCWGLVRLFYKNELKIDLPSFSSEYTQTDVQRIEELIAQYKEGWESTEQPEEGSIVLFRVLGSESHVGIVVNKEQFLHVRENQDSAIENFDSPFWKKRIVGYFKYSENKSVVLNAVPHPLRTERYTMPILPGTTLDLLANGLNKEYGVAEELKSKVTIVLNGRVIDGKDWSSTVLKEGDAVEYRAVPKGSAGRMLAVLALTFVAPYLAGYAEFAYMGTAGASIAGASAVYATAYAATILVGTSLINAIAPIRPPVDAAGKDPGSAERQLMVNGGSNRQNPYGSIPVVLGKVRVTPLLGSTNYLTYENERDSYVSMLLVWGHGPLNIDASTLRIGDIQLTNYTDYNIITLDRKTEPTVTEKNAFDAIYGKDITQVQISTELICDGFADQQAVISTAYSSWNQSTNTTTITDSFGSNKGFSLGQRILTTIDTSTANNQNWNVITSGLSNVVISKGSNYLILIDGIKSDESASFSCVINQQAIANSTSQTNGTPPGNWLQAAAGEELNPTTQLPEPIYSTTIALHFPQGLRKILRSGQNAGQQEIAPTNFRFEYSIDEGLNWSLLDFIQIGGDSPKRDAFTFTKTYNLNFNKLLIRIRRETGDNTDSSDSKYSYYHQSILQNISFLRNTKPATDPLNTKIAKTAFKIKATDQLNGRVDGVNAVVQTWCKIWNGSTWVNGATSNPAALFRYVLEHPANPRKVTDASTQINLTQLQYFYSYCASKGFEYNSVMGDSRSVLDVLRDICAAGRASPAMVDGKWTVIIDEVKPNIIQHFTPHNSWGFEGSKPLPKKPDGLRVTYFDQDQDYQENEIIVYDIGKNATNSSLFESITLPGVTKKSLVIDHARWHMAQIKLRPEVYTVNADIEYLVCNRGDRVKVTHDVPMWGLGSGRIKNRISTTKFELDEELPMQANKQYTMRIRSADGTSVVRTVIAKTTDGNYSEIDFTTSTTTSEVQAGDLFLFGELGQESQDLIVLSVEPSNNKSARLTLVDYGVTSQYNIFTDYINLSESVVFESQITNIPILQKENFGDKTPTITGFVSDESVMEKISNNMFRYNMNVAYFNASQLPDIVESVEMQYDLSQSDSTLNAKSIVVPFQNSSVNIRDVEEGKTYKVRARYIGRNGRVGNWSEYSEHTVVGKTNPPSSVTGLNVVADKTSGQLLISWNKNPEIDTTTYEVRTDNSWGIENSNRIFYGDANSVLIKVIPNQNTTTYFIKAIDSSGNYSLSATSFLYQTQAVPNISNIQHEYSYNSLTSSTVTLSWDNVINSEFNIDYYEISYDNQIVISKSNSVILPANWLGSKTFTIKTVDVNLKKSTGFSKSIEKYAPNKPLSITAQVIDNNVMFYWTLPQKTSLPIDHILLKKGESWQTAEVIGEKKGEFTTVNELSEGNYLYWFACVDTSGVESLPESVSAIVSEPPDFIFHGDFTSDFSEIKQSAKISNNSLILPINTVETWQQHFVTRSWNTPRNQIDAGYPIYIQPSTATGYYEEVFDFQQVLQSSKVSLLFTGVILAGNPQITTKISLSIDNSTYVDYNGVTQIFGTNFRYVKIRLTVNATNPIDLYKLNNLYVKLDAKLINDAGNVNALLTDSLGTIVNLNKEFIDVQSITISSSGTTAIIPVYDFNDNLLSGTYSVSSNVCTVTSNNHGFITGQNIRLSIISGFGLSNVYRITSYTTNTFTVAMTTANTTGNCSIYPESFRIYLFDTSGNRVSAKASWSIKGY